MGKRLTPEKEKSILATYALGLRLWEVEKIEQVSRKAIYDVLERNGVPTRDRKNARIPKIPSILPARRAAIELVLERIERSIGPIAISDHLGFAQPFIMNGVNKVLHPTVVDVQAELFKLHAKLKREHALLMFGREEKDDGS